MNKQRKESYRVFLASMSEKLEYITSTDAGGMIRPHATSEDNICLSLRQVIGGEKGADGPLQLPTEVADFIAEDGQPTGRKFSFQLQEDFDDRRGLRHLDYSFLGRRRKNSVEL